MAIWNRRNQNGACVSSLTLICFLLLNLVLQSSSAPADDQSGTTGQENLEIRPYLIFASYSKIYKMYFNDTKPFELLQDPIGGITVVDYHYKMGLVFWMTSGWLRTAGLKQANLSDGSNMTVLTSDDCPIDTPGGLAVDWINDKIFWSDSYLKSLTMYDLITGEKKTVMHLGTGIPIGLSIFPWPEDYGWLYTVEKLSRTLYRIPVDGNRKEIMCKNINCPGTVTIEHSTQSVYWNDLCSSEIQKRNIFGKDHTIVVSEQENNELVAFSFGLAHFQNMMFWTQQRELVKYDMIESEGKISRETMFVSHQTQPLYGLQVVHPSKQPFIEQVCHFNVY